MNDVVMTRFLAGIDDIGQKVQNEVSKTLQEALEKASKLECRLAAAAVDQRDRKANVGLYEMLETQNIEHVSVVGSKSSPQTRHGMLLCQRVSGSEHQQVETTKYGDAFQKVRTILIVLI